MLTMAYMKTNISECTGPAFGRATNAISLSR